MGLLRLGFITIFLSDPLISGCMTGAACWVFTSQIKHIFAIYPERYSGPFALIKVHVLINYAGPCLGVPPIVNRGQINAFNNFLFKFLDICRHFQKHYEHQLHFVNNRDNMHSYTSRSKTYK